MPDMSERPDARGPDDGQDGQGTGGPPAAGSTAATPAGHDGTPTVGYGPVGAYGQPAGYGPPPRYGAGYGTGPDAPPGFDTAPRPGVIPLRPLGLGELFGGAAAYMRGNPGSTLLPAAVVVVVVQLGQLLLQFLLRRPTVSRSPAAALRSLSTLGLTTFPVSLLAVILGAILTAVLVVVMRGAMIGRRTALGEAWRLARSRVPGLIGLNLLVGVLVAAIAVVGVVLAAGVGIGLRGSGGALLAFVVALATMAIVAYVAVLLSLAAPAYVIEGIGVGAALRRSAGLVRGSWWRIFGVVLLAAVVVGAVAVVLLLIFGAAAVLTSPAPATASPVALVVSALVTVALYAVFTPFVTGLTTLLYADQRIRRERFDLQLATWAQADPSV